MLPPALSMPRAIGEKTKTLVNPAAESRAVEPPLAELIVEGLAIRSPRSTPFPLTQQITTIGSSEKNDLVIHDPYISSEHCLIEKRDQLYFLIDRKSRNGTFLNQILIRETSLNHLSSIQIGKTILQFRYPVIPSTKCEESRSSFEGMVAKSILMQRLFEQVEKIAPSKSTVMIYGETGTGKELIAKALHEKSDRQKNPFVVINCGAIPKDLLESELFGHLKGAFTGAHESRRGCFLAADGGTLFLDEIGEFPIELQPKLLRVLEQKEVRPVGSEQSRKIDVRIVSATHRNLSQMVAEKRFREDLFYRLHLIPLYLPPLRDRKGDIPLLVKHFLGNMEISPRALKLLIQYLWPGNIRELKNILERAKIFMKGPQMTEKDIEQCLKLSCIPFSETIQETEKNLIYEFLEQNQWNRSATARALSLPKSTLIDKIRKYNLKPPVSDRQKKMI